jgi:molecular chaperone GrpE
MTVEDDKKTPPEPAEIKPVSDAEIEYLTGPKPSPPEPAAESRPEANPLADEAKPAKPKHRRKESEAHPSHEPKDHRKEVEHLKKALRDLEARAVALETEASVREREAADFKDKYLRMAAETENMRKRLDREKNEFYQYALAEILREILLVMDNFERALKAGEETDGRGLREGVELIHKQLLDLLRKQGVTAIVRQDRRFDPEIHQAVVTEESAEVGEAVVGEELQRGYMLNERLLRPTLVKVLLPKKD